LPLPTYHLSVKCVNIFSNFGPFVEKFTLKKRQPW
jgi:hypothetical protein